MMPLLLSKHLSFRRYKLAILIMHLFLHSCFFVEPSPARNVTAVAEFPNELRVSWQPPSSPNGNVTHYYVYWQPQPLSPEAFDRRNYCVDSKNHTVYLITSVRVFT